MKIARVAFCGWAFAFFCATSTDAQSQNGVKPSKAEVQETQRGPKDRGFDPYRADGAFNEATRTAIQKFQQEKNLKQTGSLDQATVNELLKPLVSQIGLERVLKEVLEIRRLMENPAAESRNSLSVSASATAGGPSVFPMEPVCSENYQTGPSCWLKAELTAEDGAEPCYVWSQDPQPGEEVTWSGRCSDGFADGRGQLVWEWDGNQRLEAHGVLEDGRPLGLWHLRRGDGLVLEADYLPGGRLHRSRVVQQ